jgi:alkanesulfonate monooxygenase SsuD/methylene tetrahydromethanopterin reductase-like flavin-dependent oxidoreductase (luciferase family)
MMWYLCDGCNPVGDRMVIGFNAPVAGALAEPEALTRTAAEARRWTWTIWRSATTSSSPPISKRDIPIPTEFPQGARGGRHEQLTEIAILAAKRSRLRLVTSVMVAPHRPAVPTAKILSMIDVLSKGQLTVGVGAGWLGEEFEAIGAHFAGSRRIDDGRNAEHDDAVPRRGFGAGLTGPTSPAFIDAASSSGAIGEFA